MTPLEDERRKFFRYEVDAPVSGRVGEETFEAQLKDVSATGAAIIVGADVILDNNQFVQLHMAGLGYRSGYKARDIPDGFALEFEEQDEKSREEMETALKMLKSGGKGLKG